MKNILLALMLALVPALVQAQDNKTAERFGFT
jgi:hypothetical protein